VRLCIGQPPGLGREAHPTPRAVFDMLRVFNNTSALQSFVDDAANKLVQDYFLVFSITAGSFDSFVNQFDPEDERFRLAFSRAPLARSRA
jgi:hypothetical protein